MKPQLLILSILAFGCASSSSNIEQQAEVMKTDKSFSNMSSERGAKEAFTAFAAPEIIMLHSGEYPSIGIAALQSFFAAYDDGTSVLTWEPLKAEVSGDLAYTFGNYFLRKQKDGSRDTTYFGNYVTIWKRQADSTWKVVFDAGNPAPAAISLPVPY